MIKLGPGLRLMLRTRVKIRLRDRLDLGQGARLTLRLRWRLRLRLRPRLGLRSRLGLRLVLMLSRWLRFTLRSRSSSCPHAQVLLMLHGVIPSHILLKPSFRFKIKVRENFGMMRSHAGLLIRH